MSSIGAKLERVKSNLSVLKKKRADVNARFGAWSVTLSVNHCQDPAACFTYQQYFLRGLDAETKGRMALAGHSTRILSRLLLRGVPGTRSVLKALAPVLAGQRAPHSGNHVGRYTFSAAAGTPVVKVAIDAEDDGITCDRDSLDWSDIYFKTNKWSHVLYDPKVRPCLNGNSLLDAGAFKSLRALRNVAPKTDLVYWTKIWGRRRYASPDTNRAIVEHQLRVFEALARLPCRRSLLAILPAQLRFVDLDECRRRLDRAGVPWQVGWGEIDTKTFWRSLAEAKIVFARPGNHHCISWRMTDLLCMGACVMFDGAPYPQWYAPLVYGEHFVDAGCRMSPGFMLPEKERYAAIPDKVLELLDDEDGMRRMRQASAEYFERHVEPGAAARYIMAQIRAFAAARIDRSAAEILTSPM